MNTRTTKKKEHIIRDLQEAIRLTIKKAKVYHRHYLQAIREGDIHRQCSESANRSDQLQVARMMKQAFSARRVRPWGYLHKVQARRWEREEMEKRSEEAKP